MTGEIITKNITELQKQIEYQFSDVDLLRQALTHPSCYLAKADKNYERLEFLGDAVLNLIITEILFKKYNKMQEDKLSTMRAKLVSCSAICIIANDIRLKDKIILSPGEEKNGGRENPRNLENAMEALLGAIYLDSNIDSAKIIIQKLWNNIIENQEILGVDAKTILQEWAQKHRKQTPIYEVIGSSGPSHAPIFSIAINVQGFEQVVGSGSNKKEAEKNAAMIFLEKHLKNQY